MRRGQGREAKGSDDEEDDRKKDSSSEDETKIVRLKRAGEKLKRGVKETTRTKKQKRDSESDDDDDGDDDDDDGGGKSRKNDSLSVTFKSDRKSVKENPRDMGATSTAQYDTEHDRDSLAIAERALKTQKELGGKEDDKVGVGFRLLC